MRDLDFSSRDVEDGVLQSGALERVGRVPRGEKDSRVRVGAEGTMQPHVAGQAEAALVTLVAVAAFTRQHRQARRTAQQRQPIAPATRHARIAEAVPSVAGTASLSSSSPSSADGSEENTSFAVAAVLFTAAAPLVASDSADGG